MTHDEARAAVVRAIEANGRDVARGEEYDVDAIVAAAYTWNTRDGYTQALTPEEFWRVVEEHELPPPVTP